MFRRLLVSSTLLLTLLTRSQPADAGWWDDFVSTVQERVSDGVSFLRDSLRATQAVGAKLNQAKAVLEDYDSPEELGDWFKEASAPVQEKLGELNEVVNDQVAPEAKEVVDAASSIMRVLSGVKPHDVEGTTSDDDKY